MQIHRFLAFVVAALMAAPALAQEEGRDILSAGPETLAAVLKDPNASDFEKAKACQRLAVVGTKNEVPVLAELLADEKFNLYARFGLEGIQDPAADEALRQAAGKLEGRPLVGVLNSIGRRRDAQAVELLKERLASDDQAVAAAAAGALGRIGTLETAKILKNALAEDSPAKREIADACLACAEALAAEHQDEALALYQAVAKAEVPQHVQIAALQGQFRLLGAQAKDLLLEQIRSEDEAFFNLGLAVARELPGEEASSLLAEEMKNLPPPRQALVLLALADRKEPVPADVLAKAAQSESPELREAAIRVLARSGDPASAKTLLDAALEEGEAAQIAREGLKRMSGEAVDAAIVSRLNGAGAQEQVVLLELVGARRIASARPAVERASKASDRQVRAAALNALAQLVALDDLDLLIDRALVEGDSADTAAARQALQTAAMRMSDREAASARLAARIPRASAEGQVYLLELLGRLGGKTALEAVAANAKSSNAALKDAATRVLGEWPNAEAAPALLNVARTDREPRYQVRALRGYLRIARQLQLTDEERLAMFRTAMQVARRDQEKQLAFDVLTRIPSAETLNVAVSYLDDPSVKAAAADAAIKIAPKVQPTDAKAVVTAMQKVIDADVGGQTANQARQLLRQAQSGAR